MKDVSQETRPTMPGEWRQVDMHEWGRMNRICPVRGSGEKSHKHFMKCSRCGTRRYGAYAEHGNYHYFEYDQQGGVIVVNGKWRLCHLPPRFIHETIPPCSAFPPKDLGVLEQVEVCGKCGHLYENGQCPSRHNTYTLHLLFIRPLLVPAST
ncbi:MAG: hypothetical protein AAB660_03030 [Patescibacteria group bacterium]